MPDTTYDKMLPYLIIAATSIALLTIMVFAYNPFYSYYTGCANYGDSQDVVIEKCGPPDTRDLFMVNNHKYSEYGYRTRINAWHQVEFKNGVVIKTWDPVIVNQ